MHRMLGWDGSCGRPPQLVVICSKNRGFLYCFAKTIKKNVFYDRFSTEMITFELLISMM